MRIRMRRRRDGCSPLGFCKESSRGSRSTEVEEALIHDIINPRRSESNPQAKAKSTKSTMQTPNANMPSSNTSSAPSSRAPASGTSPAPAAPRSISAAVRAA